MIAIGYTYNENTYSPSDVDEYSVGGAGVYSTTTNLKKWLTEMETHRVFGDTFWNTMIAENPAKGKGFVYTKGLFNFKYANHTMINHGGDVVGFHPITAYFPEEKIGVVILSNDNDFERYDILGASIKLSLGEKYDYPKVETAAATHEKITEETTTTNPADLESCTGNYELAPGYVISITAEAGKLKFKQLWDETSLYLKSKNEAHHFTIGGADLTFSNFTMGKAAQLHVVTSEENSIYKRLTKDPDLTLYNRYTGTFYSKALNATIVFFVEKGILRYRLENNESYIASPPDSEDLFFTKHGKITFKKNEDGDIIGFVLNHDRALNMEFMKQKAVKM